MLSLYDLVIAKLVESEIQLKKNNSSTTDEYGNLNQSFDLYNVKGGIFTDTRDQINEQLAGYKTIKYKVYFKYPLFTTDTNVQIEIEENDKIIFIDKTYLLTEKLEENVQSDFVQFSMELINNE